MTDKPIDFEPYERAAKIMRAVADARAIERGAVTAAVRNVVPDASDDEILQATMICLVRAMAEDD